MDITKFYHGEYVFGEEVFSSPEGLTESSLLKQSSKKNAALGDFSPRAAHCIDINYAFASTTNPLNPAAFACAR